MELFSSQDPRSYSLYFDLNIWFRARKVTGTFEKRAPALDSLLAAEASSFPWYSVGKSGPASWECFQLAKNIFYEFILFR